MAGRSNNDETEITNKAPRFVESRIKISRSQCTEYW